MEEMLPASTVSSLINSLSDPPAGAFTAIRCPDATVSPEIPMSSHRPASGIVNSLYFAGLSVAGRASSCPTTRTAIVDWDPPAFLAALRVMSTLRFLPSVTSIAGVRAIPEPEAARYPGWKDTSPWDFH